MVTERRVIRSIDYQGIHSVTVSEILDRFKERKVGLSVESQYDPNKIQRAAVVLKEFLAERGRQYATVDPQIEQIPPSSLKVTFNVNEGPKVKVGNINITGNKAFNDRWVDRAHEEPAPDRGPALDLFENLFAKTFDQAKLEEDKERIRQAYQDNGYFKAKTLDDTGADRSDAAARMAPAADQAEQPGHRRRYHDPGGRRPAVPPAAMPTSWA